MTWIIAIVLTGVMAVAFIAALLFRRVVSTNVVHIVQSRRKTTPYGTSEGAGNVYYAWPSFIPYIGVKVIELPVSNFDLSLKDYEAYDKDRVPFKTDITAFFRIADTAKAAQRIEDIEELHEQLTLIVQGAVRKVLASDVINTIMVERSKFGDLFTEEVRAQLAEWGVESVKSMELMDLRDGHGSLVISNIMAMKTSHIEMESRREVATNKKTAEVAEIEAEQAVEVRKQESMQAIGERTALKDMAVGIAQQESRQKVLAQEEMTREGDMKVKRVQEVRSAEIKRDEQIVAAEQTKQTQVIIAEGALLAQMKQAEGIVAIGNANAAAEQAMQLAPVTAQITLAKEIGTNQGYQQYLAMLEAIKAYMAVGGEQAKALQNADVKIISNAGTAPEGMKGVMDLFTSKGGTNIGSMIEAMAQTPMGAALLSKIGTLSQGKTGESTETT